VNALILALLLAQPAPAAPAQDVIKLKNNTEARGKITKLGAASITYTDAGGKSVTLKNEEVREFTLGDVPKLLTRANESAGLKNWEKAFLLYDQVWADLTATPPKIRDVHRQFIIFNWALSLADKGDHEPALAKLRQLRKECGDCRLRLDSFKQALTIARKMGENAVQEVLTEMKGEPEPIGGEADMELGRMKYAKQKYDEAHQIFTKCSNNSSAPYAAEARLGALRCLRALKKGDELESACSRIVSDRGGGSLTLLQTGAACLAEIQFRKAGNDRAKVRDVLMTCALAISAGPPFAREQGEDYALALFTAGRCSVLLIDGAPDDKAKAEYKARAINYFKEAASGYGKSESGQASQKELVQLGAAEAPKDPKKP